MASDAAGLTVLRKMLTDLAFGNMVSIRAQPFVARAIRHLGDVLSGARGEAEASLQAARASIEEAVRANGAPLPLPLYDASLQDGTELIRASRQPENDLPDYLPEAPDRTFVADFLSESNDRLASAETALLLLEADPRDGDALNTAFRAFHTLKGTSASLGLRSVAALAHQVESLLSRVRDHDLAYTGNCADTALRAVDTLRDMLAAVVDGSTDSARAVWESRNLDLLESIASSALTHADDDSAEIRIRSGQMDTRQSSVRSDSDHGASACPAIPRMNTVSSVSAVGSSRMPSDMRDASTLRVRTDRLDRLIDMAGELVVAQSMIAAGTSVGGVMNEELQRKADEASSVARELRELSLSMRMVSLRPTCQKLVRLARDTAAGTDKSVQLIIEGDNVEVDRNMVDLLNELLTHMIRNAVDHGLESPPERAASGKVAMGTIRLRVGRASGAVVIELSDDGRGLQHEGIARKAMERGIITNVKGMNEAEIAHLIFAPGLSTADRVTDMSGRGVGMDVVRRNLEAIRGRIDIVSRHGRGTTFTIHLPPAVAITDGMLVRVGTERFIVPFAQIHTSFRPVPSMLSSPPGTRETVVLQDEKLLIARLHLLLEVEGAIHRPEEGLLVVVGDTNRRVALLVDELLGPLHVVAKTLGDAPWRVNGIDGAVILDDGEVGLILDISEIITLAVSDKEAAACVLAS